MTQDELLQLIEQAEREQWTELDLRGQWLRVIPPEIGRLTQLETLRMGPTRDERGWLLRFNFISDLPAELGRLTNLTSLDLSYTQISALPDWMASLTNLTSLYLSGTQISALPDWMASLTNLTSLYLSGTQISALPDWMASLTNLTSLYLSGTQISALPGWMASLTNLTSLHIGGSLSRGSDISKLPDWMALLTNLTSLDLSNTQISALPDWIASLTNLTSLNLSGTQISALPDWMGQLTNLTSLDLSYTEISALPESMSSVKSLSSLDLGYTRISVLPHWFSCFTDLTALRVGGDLITQGEILKFPDQMASLANLTSLHLTATRLSTLPDWIAKLRNLTSLHLTGVQISTLPDWISSLTNLTSLIVSESAIETLPSSIAKLTNLKVLELSYNNISLLSDWVADFTKLTSLSLRESPIRTLPDSIGSLENLSSLSLSLMGFNSPPHWLASLTKLVSLDLSYSEISTLPDWMAQLTNLTALDLSNTQISALPGWMASLTNLTSLDLRYTPISALPDWMASLTNLTSLYLGRTRISALPDWMASLTNLTALDLSGTQISALPDWMASLTKLRRLSVENTRLPLPAEVLRRSFQPALILETYFADNQPLLEAKLLIVGQGSVGKTSLMKRLNNVAFDPHEPTTHGINVQQCVFNVLRTSGDDEVRINMWDFGGQEIMHSTHQFFLTRRSVYVLVLNAREDEKANRLHYWLRLIRTYAPHAPIIVVANKIDGNWSFTLDERGLDYRYGPITAFVKTSCADPTPFGIDTLRAAISDALAHLPHIYDRLPAGWFDLKRELETMPDNTITYEEYQRRAAKHKLEDTQLQRSYAGVLHDLGAVLTYLDDPYLSDYGILNRQWVVEGVYDIITSKQLAGKQGKLQLSDLQTILKPSDYPPSTHRLLIELMQKFELCYPFNEAQRAYLVPDLLPKQAPQSIDFSALTADALAFRITYKALPQSILSRFIVRQHKRIVPGQLWRTGVVLQRDGCTAFVRSDADGQPPTIHIDITGGPDRKTFLELIRDTFADIHPATMETTEVVPIPGHDDATVPYKNLLKLVNNDDTRTSYYVPEIDDNINPLQLLGYIESDAWRLRRDEKRRRRAEEMPEARMVERPGAMIPTLPQRSVISDPSAINPTPIDPATRALIDKQATAYARRMILRFIGALALFYTALAVLTIAIGWNVMEPWVYFLGVAGLLGVYTYAAITQEEWSPKGIFDKFRASERNRLIAFYKEREAGG